jgi:hypothetical protein
MSSRDDPLALTLLCLERRRSDPAHSAQGFSSIARSIKYCDILIDALSAALKGLEREA